MLYQNSKVKSQFKQWSGFTESARGGLKVSDLIFSIFTTSRWKVLSRGWKNYHSHNQPTKESGGGLCLGLFGLLQPIIPFRCISKNSSDPGELK